MPELRIDPICGRRVYIAEDRAGRPFDYDERPSANVSADECAARIANCPFCAGHEAITPIESAVVLDDAGQWQVRVVPNKYPAVTLAAEEAHAGFTAAVGAHEVIIESPRHLLDVTELDADRLATVIRVYRDRLRHWAADPRLKHALVFKNSGWAAGASLEHVHSQLAALPYVPAVVHAELDGAHRHFAAHRRCAFCDLIRSELEAGERLVARGEGFIAFCASAGRQPYETWILPEGHAARFDVLTDAQARAAAVVLQDVLRRLHVQTPSAAYNVVLHTSPFDDLHADAYHWHWELIPRIANLAGLELGAGVYINPLSPEHAAQRLRDAQAPPMPPEAR
jgi:UDPglucose--hexose-1-phosphate uridylyltransferase